MRIFQASAKKVSLKLSLSCLGDRICAFINTHVHCITPEGGILAKTKELLNIHVLVKLWYYINKIYPWVEQVY